MVLWRIAAFLEVMLLGACGRCCALPGVPPARGTDAERQLDTGGRSGGVNEKYTRLKWKMLLLVVAGTCIAGAVGLFLLEVVADQLLQDPISRLFIWAARTLFARARSRPPPSTKSISGTTSRRSSPSW